MELSNIVIPESVKHSTPIVTCVVEGILDEEDLRVLAMGLPPGEVPHQPQEIEDPSDLRKIREKHHSVARMVAAGMTQRLVATIAGYTEQYVSVLLNSPAMHELVEMYRIQNGAAAAVITEKLKTVGGKALEQLDERIDRGELNNNELLQAAKMGMDRSGFGPASKTHLVDERHIIDHAEITRLHNEARKGSTAYTVPVDEVRKALAPPTEDAA